MAQVLLEIRNRSRQKVQSSHRCLHYDCRKVRQSNRQLRIAEHSLLWRVQKLRVRKTAWISSFQILLKTGSVPRSFNGTVLNELLTTEQTFDFGRKLAGEVTMEFIDVCGLIIQ